MANGYATSHRAVRAMQSYGELPTDVKPPLVEQLPNSLIEQDHRGVKLPDRPDARLQVVLDRGDRHRRD